MKNELGQIRERGRKKYSPENGGETPLQQSICFSSHSPPPPSSSSHCDTARNFPYFKSPKSKAKPSRIPPLFPPKISFDFYSALPPISLGGGRNLIGFSFFISKNVGNGGKTVGIDCLDVCQDTPLPFPPFFPPEFSFFFFESNQDLVCRLKKLSSCPNFKKPSCTSFSLKRRKYIYQKNGGNKVSVMRRGQSGSRYAKGISAPRSETKKKLPFILTPVSMYTSLISHRARIPANTR